MSRAVTRKAPFAAVIAAAALLVPPAAAQAPGPSKAGVIERLDARFDRLIPPGAVMEKIVDGHDWVEGPVWNRKEEALYFSDVPRNSVFRWKEGSGVERFLTASGHTGREPFSGREPGSNGLAFDRSGRLVLCQHGDRRVARLEPDGSRTVLADRYEGKRLNSPNDLLLRPNGDLCFTDPPFGLPKGFDDPGKELDFQGVYCLSPNGKLRLLTKEVRAPNGLAFSPDEKMLYVSNADPARPVWLAFEVRNDDTLGRSRVLFDATSRVRGLPGVPDGMKIDHAGNLFAAAPGGIFVLAPDGTLLGILHTGTATGNCAWGGDGSALYITADHAIHRVRTATRGKGF